jgi:hypothetical protein
MYRRFWMPPLLMFLKKRKGKQTPRRLRPCGRSYLVLVRERRKSLSLCVEAVTLKDVSLLIDLPLPV